MKSVVLDENWTFRRGFLEMVGMLDNDPGEIVNLPHDGMIGTQVSPDAPAGSDSGYFKGGQTNYTKYVFVPGEWKDECIGLSFDGAMMNATVEINGSKVCLQHNGYMPFYADLTKYVSFGKDNRITINLNTTMQPNSRWYTGSGLYRGVKLMHGPRVHMTQDGAFIRTREVSDGYAFLDAEAEVVNETLENRMAEVCITLFEEGKDEVKAENKSVVHIKAGGTTTARMAINVRDPKLWDVDEPNLYRVSVKVRNLGVYRTHPEEDELQTIDETDTLFGIRTITADAVRGLRINGRTVKLKGGCLHHDNGLLGAVSVYETEARKVRKLKEVGFNAIRTAHNPPSSALIEACDRLGMYVFDEAFDAWIMGKRGGDYNQYFENDWKKDLTAFVKRDRNHPCVIMWSTGNEIPERGGLSGGYDIATNLAQTIRQLDGTRPVSNGICSMWNGLDDELAKGQSQAQNSSEGLYTNLWERVTEAFTNGMDIVGYNYMEDIYKRDHEMFPDRVILGSENFPVQIGYRWPMVESLPYVIGDFTWTAWDYIGEAGIGKAAYVDEDDPLIKKGPWGLMPQESSYYPWRTANDADYDITGKMLAQGCYRSVVWGSDKTFLFSLRPETFGKTEIMSPWGFPAHEANWSYKGFEGKPVRLFVYSRAEEVEVFINGESIGKKKICMERPMPYTACFDAVYNPGKVVAVSYAGGKEISRAELETAGEPAKVRLVPEKNECRPDGHDLIYVGIEVTDSEGRIVPDAEIPISAEVTGPATLAGFGSANPITDEDYTDDKTTTFRGRAMAVIRAGYESGEATLRVSSAALASGDEACVSFRVQ